MLTFTFDHFVGISQGLPILKKVCARLWIPNHYSRLAAKVKEYHTHCYRIFELRPANIVDVLSKLGVFKPENETLNLPSPVKPMPKDNNSEQFCREFQYCVPRIHAVDQITQYEVVLSC